MWLDASVYNFAYPKPRPSKRFSAAIFHLGMSLGPKGEFSKDIRGKNLANFVEFIKDAASLELRLCHIAFT